MNGRTDRHSYWRKKSTVAAATANNQRIPTDIVTIQQTSDSEKKKLKIKTLKQPTDTRFVPSRYMYVYATLQPVKQTTRHSSIVSSDTQTRDPQVAAATTEAAVVASQQHF